MLSRGLHHTDLPTSGRNRVRRLGRHINHQLPSGVWLPSHLYIRPASTGETFMGAPVENISNGHSLQLFFGAGGLAGKPWFGVRRSEVLGSEVLGFLVDGVYSGQSVDPEGRKVTMSGVLPNTDLVLRGGRHFIEKWLQISAPVAGSSAKMGVVLPAGWTLEIVGDGAPGGMLMIRDGSGVAMYASRNASGRDANGNHVPTTLTVDGASTIEGMPCQVIEISWDDSGAAYPLSVDPAIVNIGGTVSVEDTEMFNNEGAQRDYNYGNLTSLSFGKAYSSGSTWEHRALLRVQGSAIPAGEILSFSIETNRLANGIAFQPGGVATFQRILAANDWIEGTSVGFAQSGAASWNAAKNGSQPWAGAPGCYGAAVDFENDPAPPQWAYAPYTSGPEVPISVALKPQWAADWRDGVMPSNGIVMSATNPTNQYNQLRWRSSEGGLSFDITYEPAAGGSRTPWVDPRIGSSVAPTIDPRI